MAGNYRESPPGAALRLLVECFWTQQPSLRPARVLPDACIDIVFSRAGGLQLAGTMTRPLVAPAARDAFVGVRFRPGMACCLLGAPAAALADRVLPLDEIWGKRGRALAERLANSSGPEEMLAHFEAVLKPSRPVSPVQSAIGFLARNAGRVSLKEISRYAGLGERQLRRRCLEETGITPKQLARIARFRRACSSLPPHSKPDWALFAAEYGYYDQSHFIHEFQQFSGYTPGDYVRLGVAS